MPATERVFRTETSNYKLADDNANEEDCEQALDFWSDEGARIFNQMIDEGSAYLAANPHLAEKVGEDSDGDECECLCAGLRDPDEEGP